MVLVPEVNQGKDFSVGCTTVKRMLIPKLLASNWGEKQKLNSNIMLWKTTAPWPKWWHHLHSIINSLWLWKVKADFKESSLLTCNWNMSLSFDITNMNYGEKINVWLGEFYCRKLWQLNNWFTTHQTLALCCVVCKTKGT